MVCIWKPISIHTHDCILLLLNAKQGLQVVLQLDQESYMKNGLTQSSGVRLGIHHSEIDILPDEFGQDVEPKSKVSVGVYQEEIYR